MSQKLKPYLLLAPALSVFVVFYIMPTFFMGILSFSKWNMVSKDIPWVGMTNYVRLLTDASFLQTIKNTFVYTGGYVLLVVLVSLPLAVWLNKNTVIHKIAQAAVFSPHIVSLVSVSMVFMYMMDPRYGLFNYLLSLVHIPPVGWLNDAKWALLSLVLVSFWKTVGYYTLILVAALSSIPKELYEAAELDNANVWRRFSRITLPNIAPTIYFVVIINIINAVQVFETINIMTQGGPANATMTLVYYIYQQGFIHFNIGQASAAGMILLLILLVLTYFYFNILAKRIQYQK